MCNFLKYSYKKSFIIFIIIKNLIKVVLFIDMNINLGFKCKSK